jgi:hypothetical protein
MIKVVLVVEKTVRKGPVDGMFDAVYGTDNKANQTLPSLYVCSLLRHEVFFCSIALLGGTLLVSGIHTVNRNVTEEDLCNKDKIR